MSLSHFLHLLVSVKFLIIIFLDPYSYLYNNEYITSDGSDSSLINMIGDDMTNIPINTLRNVNRKLPIINV